MSAKDGKMNDKSSVNDKPNEMNENRQEAVKNSAKNAISTRQYLESTVVNAVMQGMAELSKQRPDNPLEFLGNYLINKSKESES